MANDNKNWFLKNIIGIAVFLLVLIFGTSIFLGIITRHNSSVVVPDLSNLTYSEARRMASQQGLRVEVEDSVFVRRMTRGTVFSQHPKPGAEVKKDRTIALTLNAMSARKVTMPSLVGCSMRQAKAEILSKGLTVGKLIYRPDLATNNVMRQLYKGKDIAAGRQIDAGSVIDLVLGLNSEDGRTYVPNVKGLNFQRATDIIKDNSLNVADMKFARGTRTYADSLACVVYKQSPEPGASSVPMGTEVVIYLQKPKEAGK